MATGIPKTRWNQTAPNDPVLDTQDWDLSLQYKNKASEEDVLATTPAELKLIWSANKSDQNRLYYGDNLPILAALAKDPAIRGQVKLICTDPPFSTNSVFQSRTQTDAYQDLLTGANYVEFIRKRLLLLRELLAPDGSIYVHLNDKMAFHIKLIMDEVFGPRNFRNWITRRKSSHKNYTKRTYGNISDYILFYSKSDSYIWNRPVEKWTAERAEKEYQCIEIETGRRYKKVPVHAPGERNGETGKPWRGKLPPPGKHWQYPPATLDEMDKRGEIYWSPTGNPRRKIYLDKSEGVPIQDIWYDFRDVRNQNTHITGYPTEKNPLLYGRLINASSNPGDIVMDAFAGSGTTPAAAARQNRRWIAIDNSPEALATMLRRFSKGTERMGDFVNKTKEMSEEDNILKFDLFASENKENSKEDSELVVDYSIYAEASKSNEAKDIVEKYL